MVGIFIFCSGKLEIEETNLVSHIKLNKLTLKEDINTNIREYIEDKIDVDNLTMFLQLAKLFKVSSLSETALCYTECCFAKVSETQNFLELHFNLVAKILASSELSVHSELEVFNAANNWLTNNSEERSKFAKQLLLHVRLPFLSNPTLKYILDTTSLFSIDNECGKWLVEAQQQRT